MVRRLRPSDNYFGKIFHYLKILFCARKSRKFLDKPKENKIPNNCSMKRNLFYACYCELINFLQSLSLFPESKMHTSNQKYYKIRTFDACKLTKEPVGK